MGAKTKVDRAIADLRVQLAVSEMDRLEVEGQYWSIYRIVRALLEMHGGKIEMPAEVYDRVAESNAPIGHFRSEKLGKVMIVLGVEPEEIP
jgi:hypothetical protein